MSASTPFEIKPSTDFWVTGNTKPFRAYFKRLGGKWIAASSAWMFDELLLPSVKELQRQIMAGEVLPATEEEGPPSPDPTTAGYVRVPTAPRDPKDWRNDVNKQGTRTGKKWTLEEEDALLEALKEQPSVTDLAALHKRTDTAITSRIHEIAHRMHKEGKSEYEITKATWLPADKVTEIIRYGPKGNWRGRQASDDSL